MTDLSELNFAYINLLAGRRRPAETHKLICGTDLAKTLVDYNVARFGMLTLTTRYS